MRLFIALNPTEEEREWIHQATAPLRSAGFPVRWNPPEALHLTLKFLGETDPARLPEITNAAATAAARARPIELRLDGIGAFPSLRNPRVLWLGVEATSRLRMLKQDLEWEFAPLGFPRENRAFQPHITLGRARPNARAGDFRALESLRQPLACQATLFIAEIEVMRSHLAHTGAAYERIATLPLG